MAGEKRTMLIYLTFPFSAHKYQARTARQFYSSFFELIQSPPLSAEYSTRSWPSSNFKPLHLSSLSNDRIHNKIYAAEAIRKSYHIFLPFRLSTSSIYTLRTRFSSSCRGWTFPVIPSWAQCPSSLWPHQGFYSSLLSLPLILSCLSFIIYFFSPGPFPKSIWVCSGTFLPTDALPRCRVILWFFHL